MEHEDNLNLPGLWIDHPDRDFAVLAGAILDEMLDQLNEARLVLTLYQDKDASTLDPTSRDQRLRHVYAKSFVYALDAAAQLVRVLSLQDQVSTTAREQCERILIRFGTLREFRNSLQHIEDRLRGIGRNGKPIPSPFRILGTFRNHNIFGVIVSNGQ